MPSICLLVALAHLPMHGGEICKRKEKSNYLLERLLFVTVFFQCFLFLSILKISFMLSDMCILSSGNDATFFPNRWAFFDFQCKKKFLSEVEADSSFET